MERLGIEIEVQHHEVATAGQAEIDMRFDTLLAMADKLMLYKYVVKNVARAAGYTATFMPKPLFQDNGSGMHCHQSLWKDGEPLFYGETATAGCRTSAAGTSAACSSTPAAVLAFAAPTTNSYKRLVPGYEAPVNLVYSQRNRSAACRIPLYSQSPKAKRVEFRCPDPSCNPYLAFSAMLMAGLDGVQNRIEPPDPVDKDLYDLPPEELAKVPQVPASLDEALRALEADHDFLKAGGVFTDDLIETWIELQAPERDRRQSGCARTPGSSCSTTTSRVLWPASPHSARVGSRDPRSRLTCARAWRCTWRRQPAETGFQRRSHPEERRHSPC